MLVVRKARPVAFITMFLALGDLCISGVAGDILRTPANVGGRAGVRCGGTRTGLRFLFIRSIIISRLWFLWFKFLLILVGFDIGLVKQVYLGCYAFIIASACLSVCLSGFVSRARFCMCICARERVCVVFVHLIPYFCASLIRSLGHSVFLYIIDITSSPPPTLSGCIKKTTFSLKPLKIVACFNVCPWELLILVSFFFLLYEHFEVY